MPSLSKEASDFRFLFETYQACISAITREEAEYVRMIEVGDDIHDARLTDASLAEIRATFERYRRELEYSSSLALLARIEAIVFDDFWSLRSKSEGFRSLRSERSRLALGAILHEWRVVSVQRGQADLKTAVDNFGDALALRHWLAHGRRWHASTSGSYPFEVIYQIGLRIDQLLRGYR